MKVTFETRPPVMVEMTFEEAAVLYRILGGVNGSSTAPREVTAVIADLWISLDRVPGLSNEAGRYSFRGALDFKEKV